MRFWVGMLICIGVLNCSQALLAQDPPVSRMSGAGATGPIGAVPPPPPPTSAAAASGDADASALPMAPTAFAGIVALLALFIVCYPFQKDERVYEDD